MPSSWGTVPCYPAPLHQRRLLAALDLLDVAEVAKDAHTFVQNAKAGHIDRSGVVGMVEPRERLPGSSSMGPSLSTLVSVMQLGKVGMVVAVYHDTSPPQVVEEFELSIFGAATCTFCKAGLLFLQYYLDTDASLEVEWRCRSLNLTQETRADMALLCGGVTFISSHVCRGLVGSFAEQMVTVLR